jgi:hypothetical protein
MPRGGKRSGAGRPSKAKSKVTKDLQAIIDSVVDPRELIVGLHSIAASVETPQAARVAAYKELMDRRYGKAPQAITGANGGPVAIVGALGTMTDEQVQELIAQLGGDADG